MRLIRRAPLLAALVAVGVLGLAGCGKKTPLPSLSGNPVTTTTSTTLAPLATTTSTSAPGVSASSTTTSAPGLTSSTTAGGTGSTTTSEPIK